MDSTKITAKRARIACQSCRARKIKCDLVQQGTCCTRCYTDDMQCVPAESSRRQRKEVHRNSSASVLPWTSDTTIYVGAVLNTFEGGSRKRKPRSKMLLANQGCKKRHQNVSDSLEGSSAVSPVSATLGTALQERTSSRQMQSINYSLGLPAFIKPITRKFDPIDLEILVRKGSFWLPEVDGRQALLNCYLECIHPLMPILDRDDILQAFQENFEVNDTVDNDVRVSILLVQAILFAASSFVEIEVLKSMGYQDRHRAREAFHQRAVLLHDFNVENDQTTLLQASLLLTYWVERPDEERDSWFWLHVAKSMLGKMQITGRLATSRTSKVRGSLKRLWWCCHIRESCLNLGSTRPITISIEVCLMPTIVLDDFGIYESQRYPSPESPDSSNSSMSLATWERSMALICIEMSKLCLCMRKVLWLQSTSTALSQPDSTNGFNFLKGITSESVAAEFRSCDRQLTEWFANLSPESACAVIPEEITGAKERSLALHRILLEMTYFGVMNALYRSGHQFTSGPPYLSPSTVDIHRVSGDKLSYAAREVSRLSGTLLRHNLTHRLPPFSVTLLLQAIIVHLQEIKLEKKNGNRSATRDNLRLCKRVLEDLAERFETANQILQLLNPSFAKAGILDQQEAAPEHSHEDGTYPVLGVPTPTLGSHNGSNVPPQQSFEKTRLAIPPSDNVAVEDTLLWNSPNYDNFQNCGGQVETSPDFSLEGRPLTFEAPSELAMETQSFSSVNAEPSSMGLWPPLPDFDNPGLSVLHCLGEFGESQLSSVTTMDRGTTANV